MKCKTRIISLDLETTGIIPGKNVPISIGAVKLDADLNGRLSVNSFYVQIEWDSLVVDPGAMKINCLDIANPPGKSGLLSHHSLPADEALSDFRKWIGEVPVVAMGKNVGSFDLPMLKAVWNHGFKRIWPFGYRSIDLNTLFFTLSELLDRSFDNVKNEITRRAWSKVGCLENLSELGEHHALGDAWWNVFAWQNCMDWLTNLKG